MRLFGLLLAATVALAATPAHADPTARDKAAAQQAYAAGQAKYDAGDFLGAAEKFSAAYQHDPDPVYLFNLAQAYRFAKRCRDAADSYRRFLAAVPDAPNRDKVQHYLEEVDACARTQPLAEPGTTAPDAGSATASGAPDQPAPERDHSAAPSNGSPPAIRPHRREPEHSYTLSMTAVGLGAAGIVGLAVGAYFTWDVHDITAQRDRACKSGGCDGLQLRDFDNRGTTAEHREIAAYALGGAALAAAIILLWHEDHARYTIAVAPTPSGAVGTAALRF